MKYVFEVSWEVCNKVGGIHTVIATKAGEAIKAYGDGYLTLGPDVGSYDEFEECSDPFFDAIRPAIEAIGIPVKMGRWKIPARPKVILVGGFKERFNIERLLHAFWEQYGVDSYEGSWDYVEPVLFSTACAEVIEAIACKMQQNSAQDEVSFVGHFHEWMCGAGALYLEKNQPQIGTVFSTHATTLGRSMAHHNPYYYHEMELSSDTPAKAVQHGVESKHMMEATSARVADCFTTVSEITGREAHLVLKEKPDMVIYNGLNTNDIAYAEDNDRKEIRSKILATCSEFLDEELPEETLIWVSSGRYEYRNKGYDIIIEALSKLRENKQNNVPPVLMLFLVAADHNPASKDQWQKGDANYRPIAISPVHEIEHDPVVNACKHFGLDERAFPVRTIFSTLYVDGNDGIFNIKYDDILKSCDLSLFPSFYEPWGYTPLESAVRAVPTITSDLSGFGYWIASLEEGSRNLNSLVRVLNRRNKSREETVNNLARLMQEFIERPAAKSELRQHADYLRSINDWKNLFQLYQTSYDIAIAKGYDRQVSAKKMFDHNPFKEDQEFNTSANPLVQSLALEFPLPDKIRGLNEIAYNLWWSWSQSAKDLFASINPELWNYFDRNPLKVIKSLTKDQMNQLMNNQEFMANYESVYAEFKNYMQTRPSGELFDPEKPVTAYFSMEYGLHECLPIYSGGLGVLSGDHLKASSDEDLNLVALGLYYHEGYFVQEINNSGYQVEHFPYRDWKTLPVKVLLNRFGDQVKIPVELQGRSVWARVLQVQVGRIPLFLFDTDIDENSPEDRAITAKLYVSDREMRLKQEMLIGIAGIRLLKDVLNLDAGVYHLNEGHCAFIAVERMRRLFLKGFTMDQALERMSMKTVFTTHTPVPAGNEVFNVDMLRNVFGHFFNAMHCSIEDFINLGRKQDNAEEFSMTVLALKTSKIANSVSRLHGEVSAQMWNHVVDTSNKETFTYVTNGVHRSTWVNKAIRDLHDEYGDNIPKDQLWHAHQGQKKQYVEFMRNKIFQEYSRRGLELEKIKQIQNGFDENTLLIGFARRFAPYKRANLLLADPERLEALLNNPEKPITIVFAGKAHPADGKGKELIQNLYNTALDNRFIGRLILVENYDIQLGFQMTNGSDIWLNNPTIKREACGTSGMKAAMAGVPNLSIADGWWAEAYEDYQDEIGWLIPHSSEEHNQESDWQESKALFEILENTIVPMYYNRDAQGLSKDWTAKMQSSISKVARDFSAKRMIQDYESKIYQAVLRSRSAVKQ